MDKLSITVPFSKLTFPYIEILLQNNEVIVDLLVDILDTFNEPSILVIVLRLPICIKDALLPILKLPSDTSIVDVYIVPDKFIRVLTFPNVILLALVPKFNIDELLIFVA